MSKRLIAGVAGVAYGSLVIALSPWREFLRGRRALRSLGDNLAAASDAIAAETIEHIEAQIALDDSCQSLYDAHEIHPDEGSYP